jgi:integrase
MPRGAAAKKSAWDAASELLKEKACSYRMRKLNQTSIIQIREVCDGKVTRQFSSRVYLANNDEHILNLAQVCLRSGKLGYWTGDTDPNTKGLGWAELARVSAENINGRILREASKSGFLRDLKTIGGFTGEVSTKALELWAMEADPVKTPHAFRNRVDTLSQINKANLIDLEPLLKTLRGRKVKGAAKKEIDRAANKIKAIPLDDNLQEYLDQQEGMLQWTLALIATYGLRPHEAWHATGIDSTGWIEIPGDGKTKTCNHIAPPVPSDWLERYKLRNNFEKFSAELNERWKVKWVENRGVHVPVNNHALTQMLYKELVRKNNKLWVDMPDGLEWVRPYDLRHSYAVRCFTHPECFKDTMDAVAEWMGHSVEVHKDKYLRFMGTDKKNAAIKEKRRDRQAQPTQAVSTDLQKENEELRQKLEALKQLLS